MKNLIQEFRLHRFGDKIAIDYTLETDGGETVSSETLYIDQDLAPGLAQTLTSYSVDIRENSFQDSPLNETLVTRNQKPEPEMQNDAPVNPESEQQGNGPALCPDTGYPLPDAFNGIQIDKTRFRYQNPRTWPAQLMANRKPVDDWKAKNDALKREGKPAEAIVIPKEQPTGGGDANPNGPGAQQPQAPKPVQGTTGEPSSITPMDVTRGAVTFEAPEGSFQHDLEKLVVQHGIAQESDTPAGVLAAHLAATANQFNTVTRKRDEGHQVTATGDDRAKPSPSPSPSKNA